MFLGANNAALSGEFIGIELRNERPMLTVSLGARSNGSVQLDTRVNDMQWRELVVQRMGRHATLGLSRPGTDERAEEKVFFSSKKFFLNFYRPRFSTKFF